MFELVFHNGVNLQYRKSDVYDFDFDMLLKLLDTCGLPFTLYLNQKRVSYPVDLKLLCKYVA